MKYTCLEKKLDELVLEDILNKLVRIKMFKDEQKKFKETLLDKLLNSPKANHGSIGLKTINALFEENNLKYFVDSERETFGELKNKRYWIISKI